MTLVFTRRERRRRNRLTHRAAGREIDGYLDGLRGRPAVSANADYQLGWRHGRERHLMMVTVERSILGRP